ncbi:MAG: thiol peroxidase [Deltaproteobacteria bacterium]|jgi:thioredoxin-dependent peroxiredoxin|nr:thiol peroxidase [Deltaproteobacteria bacterium]
MNEYKGGITFQGNPLTLVGDLVQVGQNAPDVELTDNELKPFNLSSLRGKVCILSSVPSLDTPVCDTETRRFNQEIENLESDVHCLTVSMDLPFAQARWCGAADIKSVQTLSDYRAAAFGTAYGLLIKELHLLARAVMLVDREGAIRYVQLVKEMTQEPNYDEVMNEVKKLL